MGQSLSSTLAAVSEALSPAAALNGYDDALASAAASDDPNLLHKPIVDPSQLRRGDAIYYLFSLKDHKVEGNPSLKDKAVGSLPANILLSTPAPPKGGVHLAIDFDAFSLDARARHVAVYVGNACIPCRRPVPEQTDSCDQCGRQSRRQVVVERMNEEVMWIPESEKDADEELRCSLEWVESRKGTKGEGRKVAVLWSSFNSFLGRASRLHMPIWKLAHSQEDLPGAKVLHPDEIAARALYFLGKDSVGGGPYQLTGNNCEHFATWCATDSPTSTQVEHAMKTAYHAGLGLVGASVAVLAATILYSSLKGSSLPLQKLEEPILAGPSSGRGARRSRSRSRGRESDEDTVAGRGNGR